jgi:glutathione S-transferase
MTATLYVVNGSHPCATVERALQLKGIPYKTIEFPPPMHMAAMKLLFGQRTVPALKVNGEKISGSRTILRRLDELRPEPALLPADPAERAKVEEAEAWGDEVLQPLVRRVLWPMAKANPAALGSFSQGSKLPAIPVPVLKVIAPVVTRIEMKANDATDATYPADLRTLPELLDRVDAWIAEGVLGGEQPNAADLQITTSLRLLMALGDLRPIIEARPAGQLALRLFPEFPGDVPAGAIPAEYLPPVPAAA